MKTARKSAILVIDVQQSFLKKAYWREQEVPAFADKLATLIHGAMAKNVPIVRIMHVEPEGPFSLASGLVKPFEFVPAHHDIEFQKQAHNAFTTTGLQRWLTERGINHLVITGIRTEQCCETTTRVAYDLGFEVDFVTEATLTFPMRHEASGKEFSAEDIRQKTELVLQGRFAEIVNVDQALERMKA